MGSMAPAFFVPYAKTPEAAERLWQAARRWLADNGCPTTARRIYSVSYTHNSTASVDVIGEKDRYGMQTILLLYESTLPRLCYCCIYERGAFSGLPILSGDVRSICDFATGETPTE
jgi:hypothetical protein